MNKIKPRAVGLFGLLGEKLTEKNVKIRKELGSLGYLQNEQYIDTLPHLTLTVNKQYEGEISEIKKRLADQIGELRVFNLQVIEFKVIDGDIAAVFVKCPFFAQSF